MNYKKLAKLLIPPSVLQRYYALNYKLGINSGLSRDFQTWEKAVRNSTGYDSKVILEKTRSALLKVKRGEAVYERDSVLFDTVQYDWPLLSGLMLAAAQTKGTLNVLDFGGSLGSTYFQNRKFLCSLQDIRWNIVEQVNYVEEGRKYFEDDELKFYSSIEDCLAVTRPNVVLLSSVLQYLEHPYDVLSQIINLLKSCFIIINRTPFWEGHFDKICVQRVNRNIYQASYPMRVFSLDLFSQVLSELEIIEKFPSFDDGLFGLQLKGFIVKNNMKRPVNPVSL